MKIEKGTLILENETVKNLEKIKELPIKNIVINPDVSFVMFKIVKNNGIEYFTTVLSNLRTVEHIEFNAIPKFIFGGHEIDNEKTNIVLIGLSNIVIDVNAEIESFDILHFTTATEHDAGSPNIIFWKGHKVSVESKSEEFEIHIDDATALLKNKDDSIIIVDSKLTESFGERGWGESVRHWSQKPVYSVKIMLFGESTNIILSLDRFQEYFFDANEAQRAIDELRESISS